MSRDNDSEWSAWLPLSTAARSPGVPALPGLYRIRRVGFTGLDYIGQTGAGRMTLRLRLAMLAGVYAREMPYSDPHTAAPALWALRHSSGCDFEVSVAPRAGTTPARKGVEALAIALYRQAAGQSPTLNFGRMPPGYRKSSGNNQRLAAAGKRYRGGPRPDTLSSHAPGLPPCGPLDGDPHAADWCGHAWSPWTAAPDVATSLTRDASGLYRLRGAAGADLLYIGEGLIAARVRAHLAKIADPRSVQGPLFAATPLLCSWVVDQNWLPHQRLELETDLIGAHVLSQAQPPAAQFLG